jgi:hypothetical protein
VGNLLQLKSQTSSTSKRYKHGDKREDGYRFQGYKKEGRGVWLTEESFHKCKVHAALSSSRSRSKKQNLPFDLDIAYLLEIFPKDNKCPIFGIDLVWGSESGYANSPSLDKIYPSLGYVKGNVVWVSMYANRLKSDHSLDTLRTLLAFYEKLERRKE